MDDEWQSNLFSDNFLAKEAESGYLHVVIGTWYNATRSRFCSIFLDDRPCHEFNLMNDF
jgi:hypothetical protein